MSRFWRIGSPTESPVRRAVRLCAERGALVDADETLLGGVVRWAAGSSAADLIPAELGIAQAEVLLNLPRELVPDDGLVTAVERAARRVSYGVFAGGATLLRPLEQLPCELPVAHGFLSGTARRPPCGGDRIARTCAWPLASKATGSWLHSRRLSLAPRTGVQAERSKRAVRDPRSLAGNSALPEHIWHT